MIKIKDRDDGDRMWCEFCGHREGKYAIQGKINSFSICDECMESLLNVKAETAAR